jgi:hypothetical protein
MYILLILIIVRRYSLKGMKTPVHQINFHLVLQPSLILIYAYNQSSPRTTLKREKERKKKHNMHTVITLQIQISLRVR